MKATDEMHPFPPPGIRCPCCRRCEMHLGLDDRGRACLSCAKCRTFVRLLRRHGDEVPAFDLDDVTADVPLPGSWWIAYVKGGDGIARPLALAPTRDAAWDAVLSCPLRGAIFLAPTDPPTRAGQAAEAK